MNDTKQLDSQGVADRVLILAPVGRDAALLGKVLRGAGVQSSACADTKELTRALRDGAGAMLLTEEAVTQQANVTDLLDALALQPAWSDLPIILLADSLLAARARHLTTLRRSANLTVLERPVRILPLVSAVESALRARRRQYEIRDLVRSEQAAREAAERASQVKDEFLATVSHELRTPLSAILLWTRLLASGGLDPAKVTQALNAVERSAEAQSKLIEDLLDVSRMISGKIQLDVRALDLTLIARAALDVIRPAAEAKRIAVDTDIEQRGMLVRGDPQRIQQIIWNLLSNAVKFTPPGGRISMHVARVDGRVCIEVADTGQGIPAGFLPFVFDRFRQVDATMSRRAGGLGLGLAISRQLVDLHGGTINAESAGEGHGATFKVELPALDVAEAVGAARGASLENEGSLEGVSVLLVEDDPDTRAAMVVTLELLGAQVSAVASAGAALEVLGASEASRRADVLLSDLGLPGINGYELLKRVREIEQARGDEAIPAALITAYTTERDRAEALAAGFAAHLAKPVEPSTLAAVVLRLSSRNGKDAQRDGRQQQGHEGLGGPALGRPGQQR